MPPPKDRLPFSLATPHPGPEWMDDTAVEPELLLEAYRDLAFINRVSGGHRAVRRGLDRFVKPVTDRPWRVLDVGFGSADMWPVIRGWAAARGATAQMLGLELNAGFTWLHPGAQGPRDLILTGDALRPPLRPGAVDLAFSSQTLHHLDREQVPSFMAALARLGRQGALIMDLEREFLPWAATWLGTRMFLLGPMVRFDGPLSVRRSFKIGELHALAEKAGLKIQVMSSFPGRLLIYIPPAELAV
jgi:hypothetical protein